MILPPVDFSSSSASIRASRSIASHTHGKLSVWSNCDSFSTRLHETVSIWKFTPLKFSQSPSQIPHA